MWLRKKKLKSLIGFLSVNKIDNYNSGGKKREKKRKKIRKNLQNKSKHKNNKCFSLVTAVRVFSLAGSHSPPRLPRMPSNTVLVSGPAAGAAQILIWSYCVCSCLHCPQLSELVRFLLRELSVTFYICHRHRVCLVDRVDLIWSLYSWWEGFGFSSLATPPLGFNCGFISTFAYGSYTRVCSRGCPGGLGFDPVRARCGGDAAAWVARVLAAPGTQGSWRLGQQEISALEGYGNLY